MSLSTSLFSESQALNVLVNWRNVGPLKLSLLRVRLLRWLGYFCRKIFERALTDLSPSSFDEYVQLYSSP